MPDKLFFYRSRDVHLAGEELAAPRYFGYLHRATGVGYHYKITAGDHKIVKSITRDEVEAYAQTSQPYKEISWQEFGELVLKLIVPLPKENEATAAAWNQVMKILEEIYLIWATGDIDVRRKLMAMDKLMVAYDAWLG